MVRTSLAKRGGSSLAAHLGEIMTQIFASSRPAQFQGLQFVRANAVLLVVLCHAAAVLGLPSYFDRTLLDGLFNKGAVGVDLFFVLSGFIIVHVSLRAATLEAKTNIGSFLLKRWIRIVPMLWIAVILYAVVRYFGAHEFELMPYLNAMFLLPLGEVRPNVVWSLRHEALFYMLFAVAYLLRRRAPYVLYTWCLAPLGLWVISSISGWQLPSSELLEFLFNRANIFFGCGVLIGVVCKRYGLLLAPPSGPAALGWIALGTVSLGAFLVRDFFSTAVVAVVATLAVIVGLMTPNSRSRFPRFWEMLGNASYSIYLTHNIFLLVGATAWVRAVGRIGFEFAVPVLGIVAVGCGVLIHFLVERPLIRVTTRWLVRRNESTVVH